MPGLVQQPRTLYQKVFDSHCVNGKCPRIFGVHERD